MGLPLDLEKARCEQFADECGTRRNDISHYRKQRDSGNTYDEFNLDLARKNRALSPLLHVLILQELGVAEDLLRGLVYQSPMSFNIKRAFVDVGLLDKSILEPSAALVEAAKAGFLALQNRTQEKVQDTQHPRPRRPIVNVPQMIAVRMPETVAWTSRHETLARPLSHPEYCLGRFERGVPLPLCQSSCRADRIGTFGGADSKQWLGRTGIQGQDSGAAAAAGEFGGRGCLARGWCEHGDVGALASGGPGQPTWRWQPTLDSGCATASSHRNCSDG